MRRDERAHPALAPPTHQHRAIAMPRAVGDDDDDDNTDSGDAGLTGPQPLSLHDGPRVMPPQPVDYDYDDDVADGAADGGAAGAEASCPEPLLPPPHYGQPPQSTQSPAAPPPPPMPAGHGGSPAGATGLTGPQPADALPPPQQQPQPRSTKSNAFRSRNVYIANLPPDMDEGAVRALAAQFGTVLSIRVLVQRGGGSAYAFALMSSDTESRALIKGLSGAYIQERKLQARISTNDIKGARGSRIAGVESEYRQGGGVPPPPPTVVAPATAPAQQQQQQQMPVPIMATAQWHQHHQHHQYQQQRLPAGGSQQGSVVVVAPQHHQPHQHPHHHQQQQPWTAMPPVLPTPHPQMPPQQGWLAGAGPPPRP